MSEVQDHPGFYNPNGAIKGKIGILIESHYDETEFRIFNDYFPSVGYIVEYISNLWGNESLVFVGNDMTSKVQVQIDVSQVNPRDYAGIILIGGYAMDRLRYELNPKKGQSNKSPALLFLKDALVASEEKQVKIGTICHSLWLFCADPELLTGRKVTCAHNILYDVQNAGGEVVFDGDQTIELCIDNHLITGKHPEVAQRFVEVFIQEIEKSKEDA